MRKHGSVFSCDGTSPLFQSCREIAPPALPAACLPLLTPLLWSELAALVLCGARGTADGILPNLVLSPFCPS